MSERIPPLPAKAREYPSRYFDSAVWNDFVFRDGDIVVASYAKAGTTLVQQMIAQLVFEGSAEIDVAACSPWLDAVHPDRAARLDLLAAQSHRRIIKTHLPADALVFSDRAHYLYVGRDGRDIALSLYDHQAALSQAVPGPRLRVPGPPPPSVADHFDRWLDEDGHPFWPFWESPRTWWPLRQRPQVLFLHYARLLDDLPGELERIAAFLDLPIDPARRPAMLHHCRFEYMRAHAARFVPHGAGLWQDGGRAFFSRGRSGRGRESLSAQANARYERRARIELEPACADWLASGQR